MNNIDRATVYASAVEMLNDAGDTADFYPEYSGRAMYGSTTPGIVTGADQATVGHYITTVVLQFLLEEGELSTPSDIVDAMEYVKQFLPTRSDSMGLDAIYY